MLSHRELTDSRDQKETLVLLVSLESEVPLVVPDKEKKVCDLSLRASASFIYFSSIFQFKLINTENYSMKQSLR